MRFIGTNGFKRSVVAACNICFLKTINCIEVQKNLFGINGLNLETCSSNYLGALKPMPMPVVRLKDHPSCLNEF